MNEVKKIIKFFYIVFISPLVLLGGGEEHIAKKAKTEPSQEAQPKKIKKEQASLWCQSLQVVAENISDAPEEVIQRLPKELQEPAQLLAEAHNDINAALLLAKLKPEYASNSALFIRCGADKALINYIKDSVIEYGNSLDNALIGEVTEEERIEGNLKRIKILLNAGANINVKNLYNQSLEQTVLMSAILNQEYPIVQLLLQFSPAIDQQDVDGNTAYHHALKGAFSIINNIPDKLQEHGYSPNVYDDEFSEIKKALAIIDLIQSHNPATIENNYEETPEELLNVLDDNINNLNDILVQHNLRPLLAHAIDLEDYEAVELLLRFSPHINQQDAYGDTVYYHALDVALNIINIVGTNLQEHNYSQALYAQPESYPRIQNSFNIVQLIKSYKPDVNIPNIAGRTPRELQQELLNAKDLLEQKLEYPYSSESESE